MSPNFTRLCLARAAQRKEAPCFTFAPYFRPLALFALFILALVTPSVAHAQGWQATYNGANSGVDLAQAITVDASGNVYVTGHSAGGYPTVDDYATVKYNSAGVQQWVARYNGTGSGTDYGTAIAVDTSGNVYVTGFSAGPGPGEDYATVKYNSAGVEQWAKRYNGPGGTTDEAIAIAVDAAGNVFVTGKSGGMDATDYDYATIKYNPLGVEQWVQRYDGPSDMSFSQRNDIPVGLAVDASGNVYVTGNSFGGATTGDDYATVKYNNDGVLQWVTRFTSLSNNVSDHVSALALDVSGNVYVAGTCSGESSADYATVKYNNAGVEQWAKRYNGSGNSPDQAASLAVDPSGNVYVTGNSNGSPVSEQGYATIKYSASGSEEWVRRYRGTANQRFDSAVAIAVDANGNVYVAGQSSNGNTTLVDYATIKYNPLGVEQWVQLYNNRGDDFLNALYVDASGNAYVTGGSFIGSDHYFDYATVKYAAPRWTPVDAAVDQTDNTSRLLWRETTNRYAVWKLTEAGAVRTGKYYGPLAGYTCDQITVAPNGQTTLLWKNPAAKKAALWTLASDLSSFVKQTTYNYPADYIPSHIAADASSDIRLTWRKTSGAVAFWTIAPATGAITGSVVYGPYANLQDGPIAVGQDGRVRLLWRNLSTGGAVIWTIPETYGAPSAGYAYNPVTGATPYDIAVGADNKTRLQWVYTSGANAGKIAVWKINSAVGGTGAIEVGKFYGPTPNVSALGLSVGSDNQTQQLWQYSTGPNQGRTALWVLNDPLTSITTAYIYGPIL